MAFYSFSYCIPYVLLFLFLYMVSFKIGKISYCEEMFLFNIKNILLFFILLLFFGTRGYINTDFIGYTKYYERMPSLIENNFFKTLETHYYEKGFVFYTGFVKLFARDNYFLFQFINSLIDFIFLQKLFQYFHNKRTVSLAWLCFYIWGALSFSVNLVRNVKALVFFLWSLHCYSKRNFLQFVVWNIVAFLFHSAAIVYILSIPFILKRHRRNTFIILFVLGNICYLFQIRWITFVLYQISNVLHLGRLSILLTFYLNSENYASSYGISIGYLERFFISVLVLHYYKKLEQHPFAQLWVNSFFLYILITLYCSELMILITRVALLFMYGYWFVIPMLYREMDRKLKILFLVFLLLYGTLKLVKGQSRLISKYDSFLSNNMISLEQRTSDVYKFTKYEENHK